MNNIFALYEKGLQRLQAYFGSTHERYIDLALLKSRFLISVHNLQKYGENEPGEFANFLRILDQLHRICVETFQTDFDAWCETCAKEGQGNQIDPFYPYIGDWKSLQDGKLQQFLKNELERRGTQLNIQRNVPVEDPLERYKKIPLHAFFLFTSQDATILPYIKTHWDALESLSQDLYDIHISVEELNGAEDGHVALAKSYIVKKIGFSAYSLLPGILFWDKQWQWEFVSFRQHTDSSSITWILRFLSETLVSHPSIERVRQASTIIRKKLPAIAAKTSKNGLHHAVYLIEEDLEQSSDASYAIASDDTLRDIPATIPSTSSGISSEDVVVSSDDLAAQLITELQNLPTGDGERHEELVKRILAFCFTGEFRPLHLNEQVTTYNNRRRKDFIIDNRNTSVAFWRDLKSKGVEKILFDAKNYEHKMKYTQIISTLRYLRNSAYGNFIVFITRQGLKDFEELLEDYQDRKQVALFLNDVDVISMINKKRSGEFASSVIEDRYYKFFDMT